MDDWLCADWNPDDWDTDCVGDPGITRSVEINFDTRRVTITETS